MKLTWSSYIDLTNRWLEQYPPDIFTGESGDPGPKFVVAIREAMKELGMYEFREFCIPDHMMISLKRYVEYRKMPGSFLYAVLCNDFVGAASRADEENIRNLPAYASWLFNQAPSECWGSKEKVEKWLEQ